MCHPLSDVQATNLQLLYAIRLGMERDLVDTCRRFGLHARQAARLREMSSEALWAAVHAIGNTSLFIPRSDIIALLEAPQVLAGTLAAAHPPTPTPKVHQ
ncbi:MAG: hypothetical protein KJ011_02760 [Burkholderiaceae bacterium]|nr:hypothetical protein [Burkholderiaceae bacterium]